MSFVPQQSIFFSLTGGVYSLINSGPSGAAGPTASRTSLGIVSVMLGTTPLILGYCVARGAFIPGDETVIVGGPNGVLAASGTYTFNIQAASSKTHVDSSNVLIEFY